MLGSCRVWKGRCRVMLELVVNEGGGQFILAFVGLVAGGSLGFAGHFGCWGYPGQILPTELEIKQRK